MRAVDYALLGYVATTSVVAASRVTPQPRLWWLLLAHGLVVLLIWLVNRPGLGVVGKIARETYPLVLLPGLYAALDVLNSSGTVRVHDELVQSWEAAVFGAQLSLEWWQRSPSRLWSSIFHGAYFCYYLIVPLPALYFGLRADIPSLRRTVFVVICTFLFCYLFFVFFPVAGPYYAFPRPPEWFRENYMAGLVYRTLATGSSYGAAFPSSHVAATVAAALSAGLGSRWLGLGLLIPSLLLTLGVVYCQMHYAVDALAGAVVGLAIVAAGWNVEK